ncbi:MAG: TlpA family protein disulfide reductase [Acidimicrobiales bacterium]
MTSTTKSKSKSKSQGPPTSSNRSFLLVVVGIVVIGLLGVAFLATQRGADKAEQEANQAADVEIDGDPLAPMSGSGVGADDPAVGAIAPTLVGTDFDGTEVRIEPDGRPKVVYFLAHWCSHCQVEVPLVVELIDEGSQPENLDIYAVSTALNQSPLNFPPETWLEREGFQPPVIRDTETSSALAAYGSGGFPYAVYLDGDNRVLTRSAGELGKDTIASLWEITAAA